MFGLAYAILPISADPLDAIGGSLARFERGGRGDVPDDWLAFHDETAELRAAHEGTLSFTRHEGVGLGQELDRGEHWQFRIERVMREMEERRLTQWTVRFADICSDAK